MKGPLLFAILTAGIHLHAQTPAATPTVLQCEWLSNPIGIDAPHPRLSWKPGETAIRLGKSTHNTAPGSKEFAYFIVVSTDSMALVDNKTNSLQSRQNHANNETKSLQWRQHSAPGEHLITYQGKSLQSYTRYWWKVSVPDGNGHSSTSAISAFETGLLTEKDWTGAWISDSRDISLKPAAYFRKSFTARKSVRSARAYITAAGLYDLYINGKKIGDHVLDPMYTRFDRRNLYVTYDVTENLQSGNNAIGVLLGNGWYNMQSTAVWYFDKAPWRARPAFCMDLRIVYSDGSVETISTGKDWKTSTGPLVFNSIYTAEHYDARLNMPHWNEADFDDASWKPVIFRSAPSQHIAAQAMQPIRNIEKISAVSVKKFSDTDYVFDIGRNISGVSEISLQGDAGTEIRLKHAERLHPDGHVDLSNIDVHYRPTDDSDPFQTDIYTLNGKGTETFSPHFNYKGFQFVEVTSNKPISLSKENLSAWFVHSDVRPVGHIESSNPTINKIWAATNNSYLSNLFGYPTDCPQREKNGWTGDAQIAQETGLYSFDAITIYEKWMADHRDEQQPNGVLPSIVPSDGWGYEWGNGPDWTSTIAIIPWNLYLFYGDSKCLSDCYENIKRYVDHINLLYPSGICSWGLGDWVPVKSESAVELTSTAYYFKDVTILAAAAKLFNKPNDQKYYEALASKIKSAFNREFLNKGIALYGSGVQTELSVPLYWGLVPDDMKARVASNLAKRVTDDGVSLDVGILGAKAILNALSENGYADLAYQLAAKETYPSWGWWIMHGATTLYENWDINASRDISMNHIMFGEIGAWFYKGLGGIYPDPAEPGFRHILLHPHIVQELKSFSAEHESPYGKIISGWSTRENQIVYSVTIPPNCDADLELDLHGKTVKKMHLVSGVYSYSFPL